MPCGVNFLLFIPENDSTSGEVVRAHFHAHFIPWKYADIVHSHLAGNRRKNFVPVFQLYFKHGITQCFNDNAVLFN